MTTYNTTVAHYAGYITKVDTTDNTQGGDFNNTTNPLTVTSFATNYPNTVSGGYNVVGTIFVIQSEEMVITGIAGNDTTFRRGVNATTVATHADANNVEVVTDDGFRNFVNFNHNALSTIGWVQTADTGQISLTTGYAPTAINTSTVYTGGPVNYEIWGMADALQATYPVYLRIEYGLGASNQPSVWLTVGAATDGAGNLTGLTSTQARAYTNGANSTKVNSYAGGTTSRIWTCMGQGGADTARVIWWLVERTKDSSGGDTGNGVMISGVLYPSGATGWQQYWPYASSTPGQENTLGYFPPVVGTGSNGTNIAVFPQFLANGTFENPPISVVWGFLTHYTAGTTHSFTIYGGTHTYLAIGSQIGATTGPHRYTTAGAMTPLFIWE